MNDLAILPEEGGMSESHAAKAAWMKDDTSGFIRLPSLFQFLTDF
jgi:hypothetical protein